MMNCNPTLEKAFCTLQQRGYYEDFVLFGNDLFWVQQKTFLDSTEFCIADCLSFAHPKGKEGDLVLYCIEIIRSGKKGILMNNYCFTTDTPSVILRKLHNLQFYSLQTSLASDK